MSSEPLKIDEQATKGPSLSEQLSAIFKRGVAVAQNPEFQVALALLIQKQEKERHRLLEEWYAKEQDDK